MNTAAAASDADWSQGAIPFERPAPSRFFVAHAALALGALLWLNWTIVHDVPLAIKGIGSSYLIFFYHFPSALNMGVAYTALMAFSVAYLRTKRPVWDRRARAAAEVGFLANAVLLLTGSTWAKAAWNAWWVWNDPRLMSAAVMSLVYVGYLMLESAIEEPQRRRQISAVYGILAFVNLPVVYYSIQWFGVASHPMKMDGMSDPAIKSAKWLSVLLFVPFYLLLYRWSYDRRTRAEHVEDVLQRVRRLEEKAA